MSCFMVEFIPQISETPFACNGCQDVNYAIGLACGYALQSIYQDIRWGKCGWAIGWHWNDLRMHWTQFDEQTHYFLRQGYADYRFNAVVYNIVLQIRETVFSCDYCHGRGLIPFPRLNQLRSLIHVRVPLRVPKGVVSLLSDLGFPPMQYAQSANSFRRHE